jgi:hypothetical protein
MQVRILLPVRSNLSGRIMTDIEYNSIMTLIGRKKLSLPQLQALDSWVLHHGMDGDHPEDTWATPRQVIDYLYAQPWK